MSSQYNQLIELGKDTKLIAATEVGSIPQPDALLAYEAHWLWFAAWSDTYINNPDYNSPEFLEEVCSH
jgi:mannan endo-1,4-beta-mannosidase